MAIFPYSAGELYQWVVGKENFVLLDVRNKKDFGRFKVEGPHPIEMLVPREPARRLGRLDAAEESARAAIELAPEDVGTLRALGFGRRNVGGALVVESSIVGALGLAFAGYGAARREVMSRIRRDVESSS